MVWLLAKVVCEVVIIFSWIIEEVSIFTVVNRVDIIEGLDVITVWIVFNFVISDILGVVTVFDADVCGSRFLRIVEDSVKIFVVFDEISGIMEPIVETIFWGTAEFSPFEIFLVTAVIKPVDGSSFEEFVEIGGFFEVIGEKVEEIVFNVIFTVESSGTFEEFIAKSLPDFGVVVGIFKVVIELEEEIVVKFDWVNGLLETVEFCWVITLAGLEVINFDEEFNVVKSELFDRFNFSSKVDGELAEPFEMLVFIPFEAVAFEGIFFTESELSLIVNDFLSTVALVINPVTIVEIVCDSAEKILSKTM